MPGETAAVSACAVCVHCTTMQWTWFAVLPKATYIEWLCVLAVACHLHFLAEWPGYFTRVVTKKLTLENFPIPPAGTRTGNLLITSPAFYHGAIPAHNVGTQDISIQAVMQLFSCILNLQFWPVCAWRVSCTRQIKDTMLLWQMGRSLFFRPSKWHRS